MATACLDDPGDSHILGRGCSDVYSVSNNDSNTALGKRIEEEIIAADGTALFASQDVREEAKWAEIVGLAEKTYGRVDILCNIAGISGRDPKLNIQTTMTAGPRLADQTLAHWNQVMEINATGVFLGTKAAIPAMQRAGGGSIINISSICGIVGSHANAAYHASKGAVRIFSKAAAIQYAPDKIRVNSVHPGFVDTPMTQPGHANPEVANQRLAATPLGNPWNAHDGTAELELPGPLWPELDGLRRRIALAVRTEEDLNRRADILAGIGSCSTSAAGRLLSASVVRLGHTTWLEWRGLLRFGGIVLSSIRQDR